MNQSDDNKFNKQWQDAFRNEEETPPPFIWQALEERLEAQSTIATPVSVPWWKGPVLYYYGAAACLLVACLVGGYFLYNSSSVANKQTIAAVSTLPNVSSEQPALDRVVQADQSTPLAQQEQELVPIQEHYNPVKVEPAIPQFAYERSASATPASESPVEEGLISKENMIEARVATIPTQNVLETRDGQAQEVSADGLALVALESPTFIEKEIRFNKRIIFYRPSFEEEEASEEPLQKKEYYAGASMMPALFNPNVSVASTNMSTASLSGVATRQKQNDIPSRVGTSLAVQTYGGIKLNKRWSIETGISYLKGNSVFESNGYVMDVMNVKSLNYLETALASSSNKVAHKLPHYSMMNDQYEMSKNTATYYMDVKEGYENNYSFIQLPLQAGYTLAPDKKVSYTILGGMVGNLFLQNELSLTDGGKLRTTASDHSYQPLHWSASSGLRINYQLSTNWSTMLTGSYQKALLETGSNNNGVQLKPQIFGIGWGVKVNF